ncbi:hypothetical protein ABB37_02946 [Leptomonas pyrrhocoris]|uniref:Uncharacterized protein n=1 Tax=Leptomonas pyrrhocoris TaxID=157538 RepID=A0A0N0DXR0_LEPPY|nr:hypothetical protein ABB37_02946 [Leptomonas pyrrhocoris]XP_015661713.1 hypothetical protein ABB37_02946 [Leptomonas pyrrhocoris]XP_015661714.1 hypothetical protein ABB37_02946 [Leptomonas pyrrhocoris]XP_015661715.1 hypothetical protein ABB37_02946 [Leptomonas pyrrhocoris]KPA83273.1 hypothetical protein ABB37_02946 [Leptomonas pyrrhocoris]KPA83274.1 hypothetical protein ABB37_02946 [Leptomonas pyrrhocoris]KPA83275.1 hypothetical protein ABB37_02946 [Leptomonas pyrrhocoris]KPA83276.1 hypot|eukprot:XP_015661712.1 hypothetical protein ABB37_02946 [Leptomonas pyrrhocoris]
MRRRNILVDALQAAVFPDMEFVLLRCPKFYAKENLETVFPDAAQATTALSGGAPHDSNYYLLYTFQPSDYVMQKPGDEDEAALSLDGDSQDLSNDDDDVASTAVSSPAGKAAEDDFSELIQYTPASVEWKDRSRERFFHFMKAARERIRERLNASAGDVPAALFMDWPDPATGLPVKSKRGASTFNDADTIQQFFSYSSVLIAGPGGGCRMIEHPRFGLNVYPAAGVIVVPRCEEAVLCDAVRSLSP